MIFDNAESILRPRSDSPSVLDCTQGICNHFSVMVPADEGGTRRFLINPYGLHWQEITASKLVLVDEAGRKLEGEGGVEESAFWIHSRIHIAHPAPAPIATCPTPPR